MFVDAYALFSDASGKFATSLDTGDGKDVRVRTADGVHLTEDGGVLICDAVTGQPPRLTAPARG